MIATRTWLALPPVLAALLAGCGGDDGSTTATAPGGAQAGGAGQGAGGAQTVKVSETEYRLDPADPTVKAGEVTFAVSNDGQTTHSLEVEGPGEEEELPNDLAPGESGKLTVDLSKPGTYEWYCPVANHEELGMKGEITVR